MKNVLPALVSAIVLLSACNNEPATHNSPGPKTQADSLEIQIDKAHISGMGKMGKLTRMQQYTAFVIDSLGKLPAASKTAQQAYRIRLDTLLGQLDYAEKAMDKWMMEYKADSFASNEAKRTDYFKEEKIKVEALINAIVSGIAKADTLLPKKI